MRMQTNEQENGKNFREKEINYFYFFFIFEEKLWFDSILFTMHEQHGTDYMQHKFTSITINFFSFFFSRSLVVSCTYVLNGYKYQDSLFYFLLHVCVCVYVRAFFFLFFNYLVRLSSSSPSFFFFFLIRSFIYLFFTFRWCIVLLINHTVGKWK